MKNDLFNETAVQAVSDVTNEDKGSFSEPVTEKVVIYDECGDSLWDAVLEQKFPVLKYPDIIF